MNVFYEETLRWIRSGKIGCTFATTFAINPDKIGWKFQINPKKLEYENDTYILSLIFPEGNLEKVKEWAITNGMYIEELDGLYEGLRYKIGNDVSWVQYFGPDSHCVTRQAPYSMLNLCVKLPKITYYKVGFNGILHLAHASVEHLKERVQELLWNSSFLNTEKRLGHKPTIREAAKTTYIK